MIAYGKHHSMHRHLSNKHYDKLLLYVQVYCKTISKREINIFMIGSKKVMYVYLHVLANGGWKGDSLS